MIALYRKKTLLFEQHSKEIYNGMKTQTAYRELSQ